MKLFSLSLLFSILTSLTFAAEMNFLIIPEAVIGPISPYIYGLNDQNPSDMGATIRRLGGNRMTGYNWVNNASNAGSDYKHSSDDWLCKEHLLSIHCDEPAGAIFDFVGQNQKAGMESLITVPMAGYVAADKNGEVLETEKAPSPRWKPINFIKKKPYSLTPNTQDKTVYEDEFVNYLVQKLHSASQGGVKFYVMDNEPDLWSETHPRIHPAKTTYAEMINKSELLASGILKADPTAMIFGPASYGWSGFLSLQAAPDSSKANEKAGTFLDYYLDQMHSLEVRDHKRLLHVLDIHWYPEAQGGGKRITENDITPASIEARLQAPRSLWDPSYIEKSWIADSTKQPIRLIPWLQDKITQHYPDTKLAVTEYDYGAGDHISGGLAMADALGVFGKNGVFMSSYWGDLKPYNKAALQIYRNYDGKNSTFGDIAVSAAGEDISQTSIYAATDRKHLGVLWILVINKNQQNSISGKFKVKGTTVYKTFASYGFNAKSAAITTLPNGTLNENQFNYNLAPLSATLLVCQ
jgi:mannan endo-1,4-beta-mannosidase